jgi:2'-5' RNA ligase
VARFDARSRSHKTAKRCLPKPTGIDLDISLQLLFDNPSTERLRAVWQSQAEVTGSRTLLDGPYDPHITLGLFKNLDQEQFRSELRARARDFQEFEIRFGHIGQFSGEEGTLFLVPVHNKSLTKLHQSILGICDKLKGALARPEHYLPENWVPHCSISWRTDRASILRGLNKLLSSGYPAVVVASSLHLVHTPDDGSLEKISLKSA